MFSTFSRIKKYELLLIILWLTPLVYYEWFVTIDGPAHIAMSKLMLQRVLYHCDKVQNILHANIITTNIGAQLLLSSLLMIIPENISEKMVIGLYVVMFVFGFRYLLLSINHNTKYPIVPGLILAYNGMLLNGLYNYVLSFSMMLWCIGYWLRHKDVMHGYRYLTMICLTGVMYVFHVFGMYFFALILILLLLYDIYLDKISFDVIRYNAKLILKVCIPVLAIAFISALTGSNAKNIGSNPVVHYSAENIVRVISAPLGFLSYFSSAWFLQGRLVMLLIIAVIFDILYKHNKLRYKWLCIGATLLFLALIIPAIGNRGINYFISDRFFWSGIVFLSIAISLPVNQCSSKKLISICRLEAGIAVIYLMYSSSALLCGLNIMQKYENEAYSMAHNHSNAYFVTINNPDISMSRYDNVDIVHNFINNMSLRVMGEPKACNLPLSLYQLTEPYFPVNIDAEYFMKSANGSFDYDGWRLWSVKSKLAINNIFLWGDVLAPYYDYQELNKNYFLSSTSAKWILTRFELRE